MDAAAEEEVKSKCPWMVEEADEARYNFSDQKGLWQPKPKDILSMFDLLANGETLPLKWTCPGRRAPGSDTLNEDEEETEMEVEDEQLKEEYRDPEPSAFDFDDFSSETNTKVTPWRSHAGMSRTPKTEKRVARMDNIMDSLLKQQMQRAAEREARKSKGNTPSRLLQGRGRLTKFASPSASPKAPTLTSTSVSSSEMMTNPDGGINTSSVTNPTTAVSSIDATSTFALNSPGATEPKSEEREIENTIESERAPDPLRKMEEGNNSVKVKDGQNTTMPDISSTLVSSEPSSLAISSVPQTMTSTTVSSNISVSRNQSSDQKIEISTGQTSSVDVLVPATSSEVTTTTTDSSHPTSLQPIASATPFTTTSSTPTSPCNTTTASGNAAKTSTLTNSDGSSSNPLNTTTTTTSDSTKTESHSSELIEMQPSPSVTSSSSEFVSHASGIQTPIVNQLNISTSSSVSVNPISSSAAATPVVSKEESEG